MNNHLSMNKFFALISISLVIFQVTLGMEAWSLDDQNKNNFAEGLYCVLNEEIKDICKATYEEIEIDEAMEETTEKEHLVSKKKEHKLHIQEEEISQETIELMLNFLSLPDLPKEIIISFLERHSLAFFCRLKGISNKTRCKAYKKLKYPHTLAMIKKYEKDPTALTIKHLFYEALSFGNLKNKPNHHHLYSDLEKIDFLTKKLIVNKNKLTHAVGMYVVNSGNIFDINCDNAGYYNLRKKFLKLINQRLNTRIKTLDICGDSCNLFTRYGFSSEGFCLGSFFLYFSILSPTTTLIVGTISSYVCCIGSIATCYSMNVFLPCPEKKITNKLVNSLQFTACCIPCCILCPEEAKVRLTSISENEKDSILNLSAMTNLHELKEIIQNAQKSLKQAKEKVSLQQEDSFN